ncbi:MAG: preprotein translocase subunit SecG, partial [Flavobacteriales bacterium]
LITILIVAVCLLLVVVVMIQNPKGGGISSSFGALNQIGGVKQTSEGIERLTWGLALVLVVLCLASTPVAKSSAKGGSKGEKPITSIPMDPMQGNNPMMGPSTTPGGNQGPTK